MSAALMGLILTGCATRPQSFIHPTAGLGHIERTAVIPFKNMTQDEFASGKVQNIVATELLRRGLEVVEAGEVITVLNEEGYGKAEGELSKRTALAAAKRLNVQSFILGSVHEYGISRSGEGFVEVSVSVKLLDAETHTILWEATHSKKGTAVLDRLFGIGKKSTTDLALEVVREMLDTLYGR